MRFDNAHRFDFDWDMKIQGSAESIITAVLPHEITHMILASHFKEPIPRWIDEGAATFVENEKERQNYRRLLYQYLRTGRGIPFNQMFHMAKYPDDQMPLYAQGFSLAEFLIFQQGHRHYVDFAAMGMKTKNWPQAIYEFYGYENLGELQVKWNRWVDAGCPDWAQMSVDQPIFVRDSTQYVASRDFMPTRQPMILARATHSNNATEFDQRIVQASWESPSPAAATGVEAALPRQREPLHMALSQTSQNQPLTATLTPISESGKLVPYANNYNEMSYDAPSAIVAQPAAMQPIAARPVNIAPTQMQDSVSHLAAMANVEENSSPMHVRPEQRFYQSPQNTPPPSTEPVHDARVIYDWKIR